MVDMPESTTKPFKPNCLFLSPFFSLSLCIYIKREREVPVV